MPQPEWWPPFLPWVEDKGSIRGPDNRTLTDVYNQQFQLNTTATNIYGELVLLRETIGLIENYLFRLVGTPESQPETWAGISNYLNATLGAPQSTEALTVRGRLVALLAELASGNLAADLGISRDGFDVTQERRTTDAVLSLASVLGEANGHLFGLKLVTGDVGDDPNGSTLKDLLRSIDVNVLRNAECCEEGQGPVDPPPNDDNPEPLEVSCDVEDYAYLRCSGWVSCAPPLIDNQPGLEGWVPLFSGVSNWFDGDLQQDIPAGGSGIGFSAFVNVNTGYDACLKWDFTNNVTPQLANFYRFGSDDFYSGGASPTNISPLNVPVGGFIQTLNSGIRWIPVFYTPEGDGPPGNNVWLTVLFGPA